jgi:hypothetical protein
MSASDKVTLFMEDIGELSALIECRSRELDTAIVTEQTSLESLDRLRSRMLASDGNVFDRDDVSMVDEEICTHRDLIRDMKRNLEAEQAKQAAHAKLFQEMSGALQGRSSVLEDENDVLACHPKLLLKLATKQLELETMLKDRVKLAAMHH